MGAGNPQDEAPRALAAGSQVAPFSSVELIGTVLEAAVAVLFSVALEYMSPHAQRILVLISKRFFELQLANRGQEFAS